MRVHIINPRDFHQETIEFYESFAEIVDLDEADVIVTQLDEVETDRDIIIATNCTGLDHIQAPNAKIISLNDVRDKLDVSATAEHTFGLILALLRHILPSYRAIKQEIWERNLFIGNELKEKTLGILGMGRIGKQVAEYGKAFGMNIIYAEKDEGMSIEGVFKRANIVSCHLPLNDETKGMITLAHFEKMKPKSYFINTSRGEIIRGDDILLALNKGYLEGAALDVLPDENNTERRKRYIRGDILLTPHIGGATEESMLQTEMLVARKVADLTTK